MGTKKIELTTTQSDLMVLQEKGFILEKMIGEGSYAKVMKRSNKMNEVNNVKNFSYVG